MVIKKAKMTISIRNLPCSQKRDSGTLFVRGLVRIQVCSSDDIRKACSRSVKLQSKNCRGCMHYEHARVKHRINDTHQNFLVPRLPDPC